MQRSILSRSILTTKRFMTTGAAPLVRTEYREVDGVRLGFIHLSDKSKLNALTVAMGQQFVKAVDEMVDASKQQKIRGCIVTGEGDAFSAGGDLQWLRERHTTSPYQNSLIMVDFYNMFLCLRNIHVPTFAAINGPAIGAGLCMTLACDIRLAATTAKLGFTFSKLGIHPGMGASVMLPRVVNQQVATNLLISGDIISGEEAAKLGLVLESVPKDKLLERTIEIAVKYGKNSPISVMGVMNTLRLTKFEGLDKGLQREADSQAIAYSSQDLLRGLDAVKNKKAAEFQGW